MNSAWIRAFEARASALQDLSTTSSTKYDEFKDWLREEIGVEPAVCYLSDLQKQWTARVGQAVMGLPGLLVLLINADTSTEAAHRLTRLHAYMTGLEATVVCLGDEGQWAISMIAGSRGVPLFDALSAAKPDADIRDTAPVGTANARKRTGTVRSDFMELEPEQQGEMIWDALVGRGALEVDEAIRTAANVLRDEGHVEFDRFRREGRLYSTIEEAIAYYSRRGMMFDRPRRGFVRAILTNPDEYSREAWRDCVLNSLSPEEWTDRDEVVRAAAQYAVEVYGLDMQRLRTGGRTDTGIRSAINGLIRIGNIQRTGVRWLRRNTQTPTSFPPPSSQMPASYPLPTPGVPTEPPVSVESAPPPAMEPLSLETLRIAIGEIPPEAEAVFMQLLGTSLKSVGDLRERVAEHLREFERAFEHHQFLDLEGAEQLALDCNRLLDAWETFEEDQRRVAQTAILYFVESDEADDDFRIGGLRTDKAVMAAVTRFLFAHE